ncbi:MAG: 23S rRNA (pseudouridine(1915)-N(3))-methyltransferase RlmH [Clostridia bacterium]|nr:23S rRNA (pseudouridine(1915)-N(3))-methyltransferase RlmH [Clostridia bacterium]
MKLKIISVGKIKEKSLSILIDEYIKRLRRYAKIEIVEINDIAVPDNPSQNDILSVITKEGKEILKYLSPKAYVISLCIEGKNVSSEEFANIIERIHNQSSEVVCIIGSSHGLSEEIKKLSHFKLSMSEMTFPHNIAKLMLVEQVYRAFKINNNENYHK